MADHPRIDERLGALLCRMVVDIVSRPEDVSIDADYRASRVRLRLETADIDVGRVIGSNGRTISAFREVLFAAAKGSGVVVDLEYVNDRADRSRQRNF